MVNPMRIDLVCPLLRTVNSDRGTGILLAYPDGVTCGAITTHRVDGRYVGPGAAPGMSRVAVPVTPALIVQAIADGQASDDVTEIRCVGEMITFIHRDYDELVCLTLDDGGLATIKAWAESVLEW